MGTILGKGFPQALVHTVHSTCAFGTRAMNCMHCMTLLVQKQTIPQKKALILSFLQLESLRAWHYQEGSTLTCRKKTLKKSKFDGGKSGSKQFFFKSRQSYSYIMRKVYAH